MVSFRKFKEIPSDYPDLPAKDASNVCENNESIESPCSVHPPQLMLTEHNGSIEAWAPFEEGYGDSVVEEDDFFERLGRREGRGSESQCATSSSGGFYESYSRKHSPAARTFMRNQSTVSTAEETVSVSSSSTKGKGKWAPSRLLCFSSSSQQFEHEDTISMDRPPPPPPPGSPPLSLGRRMRFGKRNQQEDWFVRADAGSSHGSDIGRKYVDPSKDSTMRMVWYDKVQSQEWK